MNLTFDLTGKLAVVTGGGGVLCSGFSKTLASAGAKVAVCDLRPDAAEKVAAEIRENGGCAAAFPMNVLEKSSVEAAKRAIYETFGADSIDLLLNGAGGNNPKGSTSRDVLTPEEAAELLELCDAEGRCRADATFYSRPDQAGSSDPHSFSLLVNGETFSNVTWTAYMTNPKMAFTIPSGTLTNGMNCIAWQKTNSGGWIKCACYRLTFDKIPNGTMMIVR